MEKKEQSRVIRCDDFRWEGVGEAAYKDPDKDPGEDWSGVTRHRLVGRGEGTPFHLRYFEVEPGGHTTYERHAHQHVVLAIRGKGEVRLGDRWEPVGFGDVVYVAPNDPHQFRAAGSEPFGFLCVVDANRDRPVPC